MADDVDPNQSLPTDQPVEIAMMEIEIVELEAVDRAPEPEPDPNPEPHIDQNPEPRVEAEPDKVVVEMATLDVVAVDEEAFEVAAPELEVTAEPDAEVMEPDAEVMEPDAEVMEPESVGDTAPHDSTEPVEALPTMADLDRVASELDEIDARLAALDEQRP